MTRKEFPRSRVERIAPALDWALLAASLYALGALVYAPQLAERARAHRVVVECSAAFECRFQLVKTEQRKAP